MHYEVEQASPDVGTHAEPERWHKVNDFDAEAAQTPTADVKRSGEEKMARIPPRMLDELRQGWVPQKRIAAALKVPRHVPHMVGRAAGSLEPPHVAVKRYANGRVELHVRPAEPDEPPGAVVVEH